MGNNTFRRFILISFQNFPAMGGIGTQKYQVASFKTGNIIPYNPFTWAWTNII